MNDQRPENSDDGRQWVRSTSPVFSFLIDRLLLGMAVVAGTIGLIGFALNIMRAGRMLDATDPLDGDPVVIVDVIRIWLPTSLDELMRSESRLTVLRTHTDFQQWLERQSQEDLWYAFTARALQRSGRFVDCTYIHFPYRESFRFSELLDILDVASADAPSCGADEFIGAEIRIMPEQVWKRDPLAVIASAANLEKNCIRQCDYQY